MPGLDPTQHFSRTHIPLNEVSGPGLQLGAQFFKQLVGSVPVDSSYSGDEYGATACGNSSSDVGLVRDSGTSRSEEAVKVGSLCIHSSEGNEDEREDDGGHDDDDDSDDDGDDHETVPVVEASSSGHRLAPGKGKGLTGSFIPKKSRPPTNPMQRKKSKNDGWEQTGPADGVPQDSVIVPSYSGHVAGCIWRGILKSRSHYVSLTGWTPSDPAVVQLAGETGVSHLRSCMFQHLNSSLLSAFVERAGARLCKPYIQRFAMLGHKTENKLIDLCIRLDTTTVDEVRWTPYRYDEITDIWFSMYHGMIAYFDCVEPYMSDRVVRQFGWVQCISAHPICP
ncbi:hypothetical protein M9H77_20830 [Catharanthus roseus]|uniref:Uncharacterized protein n=1 Tax=Catharanthus roseus TaxID=4058 RepID=A0ACC0AM43_CATRO|nr:hypothetical protein M9H77_20830 [Catharanthus roseus]